MPLARFAAVVDAMLAARAASRRSLATLRLVSAPIRGPEMAGAAGVVEQAEGDLAKGDLVFAPTLRCAWGDAATVTETLEKWWEWRKVQKPPRVFGV